MFEERISFMYVKICMRMWLEGGVLLVLIKILKKSRGRAKDRMYVIFVKLREEGLGRLAVVATKKESRERES